MYNMYLRFCICISAQQQYECARCQRTFCMSCDRPSERKETKTVVRYCPDWRCQREKQIEEGLLTVTPKKKS